MSILLSQASSDNGAFEFDLKGLGTLFEGLSGEEGEVAERAKGAMRKQVALEIRKEFPTSYGAVEEYFAVRDRVKEIQKLGKYLPEWTNEFRQQLPPFLEAYPPKYIDKDTPAYMARRDVREHWDPLQRFAPLSLKGKLSGGGGDIDGDIWYAYGDILLADFALVNARTHQMIIYNLLSLPTVHPIGPIVHVGAMDDGKTFHIAAGGPLQVPCSLMIIEVSEVDWEKETADVKLVEEILIVPKSDYVFKLPEEVDGGQNVGFFTPMITMAQTQLHAPTLVGNFKRDGHLNGLRWVYWNVYSDDRILLIDPRTNKKTNTFAFPGVSDQLHGIWTNPSGNLAFSAPTYPDGTMQLFEVDLETGDLTFKRTFYYGTRERRGLLGGPVVTWIDDRWALGGSAQYLLHASSPEEVEELIPPGMWLFDSWSETGEGIQIAEWCGGPLDGSEFPAETQCEGIIAGFNQAELVYHPSTDQLFLVVAEEDGWTKAIAWISEEGDADCEDEVEEEREKGDRGFMGEVRDCKSNKKRRKGSYAVWEVPLNVSLSTNNGVSPVEGNDPFYSFTNLRFVKRFWAGSDGYPENWHSSHLMTLIDTGVDLGSNGDAEKKKGGVKNPFDGVLGDFEKAWNEKLETEKGAESPQTLEENSSEVLLVIESVLSAIILEIDPETFSLVAYSDEIESGFLMPHSLQTDWRRKQQSWNTWLGCWPQSKCPSVMNGTS